MNVVEKAKQKRDEITALKLGNGKKDTICKAVKKLSKSEFDALPKSLQKELSEYR